MSRFLILLENIRFTIIDNANVIIADKRKLVIEIEGTMKKESPDDFHMASNMK